MRTVYRLKTIQGPPSDPSESSSPRRLVAFRHQPLALSAHRRNPGGALEKWIDRLTCSPQVSGSIPDAGSIESIVYDDFHSFTKTVAIDFWTIRGISGIAGVAR